MQMNIKNQLSEMLNSLTDERKRLNNELRRLPKGSLMISSNGPRISYFRVMHGSDTDKLRGIGRDQELVYKLAHKAYLKRSVKQIDINIHALKTCLATVGDPDYATMLSILPRHFDLLDPARVLCPYKTAGLFRPHPVGDRSLTPKEATLSLDPEQIQEWANRPYCENTKYLEYKTQFTSQGLRCRSKSEMGLLELYSALGLYYHYDEVIMINGQRVSPDIIGVRKDGRLIFHEHAGLRSEQYKIRDEYRRNLYASAGIIPGINLFYTYDDEDGNLDLKLAEALIRHYYKL